MSLQESPGPRAVAAQMEEEARNLLAMLGPSERSAAAQPLHPEVSRSDWGYFPRTFHGLPLASLDHRQQKQVHRLVSSALSLPAYATATSIMALDNVLDRIEGRARPDVRDPARYYLRIFGEPGAAAWAWQFEGHHLSLNVSLLDGEVVSATPLFMGSNPAELAHAGRRAWRLLGEEEEVARDLLTHLERDQRRRAIICDVAPPDIVLMNAPQVPASMRPGDAPDGPPSTMRLFGKLDDDVREALRLDHESPRGLPAREMSPAHRARLMALIAVYIDRLPADLAALEHTRLAANAGELHFAWAGATAPHHPHYYRIQGPGLLIEYDNTQDGANHVHAVWRDPGRDFGGDLLREHVAAAHT